MSVSNISEICVAEETAIRQLMAEWRSALCAKDLDRLVAHYSPDVVFFDVVPPFQSVTVSAYREKWRGVLAHLPARMGTEQRHLRVAVGGDLAFAHYHTRIVDAETKQSATSGWVRVTLCFERQECGWRVVHEHVSVPFDPETDAPR